MSYRNIMLGFYFILIGCLCKAQSPDYKLKEKTVISLETIAGWPSVANAKISNNGQFAVYELKNVPRGKSTLVLKSLLDSWTRQFVGGEKSYFTTNSKQCFFVVSDSLYSMDLGKANMPRYISQVSNVLYPENLKKGQKEWIVWQVKDQAIAYNISDRTELKFDAVTSFVFGKTSTCLLLLTDVISNANTWSTLQYVDLSTSVIDTIWSGRNGASIAGFQTDYSGDQVAFNVGDKNGSITEYSLWYFKKGMSKAVMIVNNQSAGITKSLRIDQSTPYFASKGSNIFFYLSTSEQRPKIYDGGNLNVWNYQDPWIKSFELASKSGTQKYLTVLNLNNDKLVQIESGNENLVADAEKGDFVVVKENNRGDRFWLSNENVWKDNYFLVALEDGKKTKLNLNTSYAKFWFSPESRYLIYFDVDKGKGDYYSFDLHNQTIKNISRQANTDFSLLNEDDEKVKTYYNPVGIGGWLKEDIGLLVYDNYDIWHLDPNGRNYPINITNGLGRSRNIKFNLEQSSAPITEITNGQRLLLIAFDMKTKYNGFYLKQLGKFRDPELLTMGPWVMTITGPNMALGGPVFDEGTTGHLPLKAKDANIWIVIKQSIAASPNYFVTKDFKIYKPISDLNPEKNIKWVTGELVTWRQTNGINAEGILYKPENFDSSKKHPLIISYYRQLSHQIYQNPRTYQISDAFLHRYVSWFASRGYCVFVPDLHFTMDGNANLDAFNTIISGADYLSERQYIDTSRMAIAGHSFAGGLTNAVIARTSKFAAAFEGAGRSDEISAGLMLGGAKDSRLAVDEANKNSSLWERPDIWYDGSSILLADKIKTPLLIFHCKDDNAMPWEQGLFMFTALRRLNKRVWMLEYDGEKHSVSQKKNKADVTVRVTQYFDHYLKDAPAPVWMTKGIPARLKGVITGFDLDPAGNCGSNCKVCKSWNEKVKKDPSLLKSINQTNTDYFLTNN